MTFARITILLSSISRSTGSFLATTTCFVSATSLAEAGRSEASVHVSKLSLLHGNGFYKAVYVAGVFCILVVHSHPVRQRG